MIINITLENVYLTIIVILMITQIYQFKLIYKLNKDIESLWSHLGIISIAVSTKFGELMGKKQIDDREQP